MELTLQLKLLPTEDQATALRATMTRFNEACNWLAQQAFARQCSNKLTLQRFYYHELRSRFALSSQMAVRCLARVAGTYKRDTTLCPTFRPDAAMPYDQRIMRFDGLDHVSLLTLQGRVLVSFLIGPYHQQRFDAYEPRQCHLVVREDGQWFLLVVVQAPEGTPIPPTDFLGVDLGVVNLATTSDGTTHSGESDAVQEVATGQDDGVGLCPATFFCRIQSATRRRVSRVGRPSPYEPGVQPLRA